MTIDSLWPTLDETAKQRYVERVVDICKELNAAASGTSIGGVEGGVLSELYLAADGDCSPQTLRTTSLKLSMDCSRLVFYHCDMGPTNVLFDPVDQSTGVIDWEVAGFVPLEWVRTKFRVSRGFDLCGGDELDYRRVSRVTVSTCIIVPGAHGPVFSVFMANREHFFFYAPTWDYPPGGPIKLGNVITSVKKPHLPLSCAAPEDSELLRTEKKSVQYTKEKLRSGRFSVLTKFLSVLGFGVDIGAEIDNSDEETFAFDTLETTQFIPTTAYFQTCINSDNVRRFLQNSRYRKPVYVITGIKVVNGAEANTSKSRAVGGTFAAEVDGTLLSGGAVPIGGGPGIEGKVATSTGTSWAGSSDFVFAFRVSKVFVGKATGQVASEEEYRKGAMLGDKVDEVRRPQLAVSKVEKPNAEAEECDTEELMDDGEIVFCAIPRKDEDDD